MCNYHLFYEHAVPLPTLTISASPRDEGFFTGLGNFSLTCSANLSQAIDSDVMVSTTWERNGSPLLSSDGITVGMASDVIDQVSNSSVMIRSLGLDDAGNYTCQVNVTAIDSNFILGISHSATRNISVESMINVYMYIGFKFTLYLHCRISSAIGTNNS